MLDSLLLRNSMFNAVLSGLGAPKLCEEQVILVG
jgi:hypothetical protein